MLSAVFGRQERNGKGFTYLKEAVVADNKTQKGPADRSRVNINEAYEVEYWSQKFGVTPQELRDAEKKVGPMAADVQKALGK